MNEWLVLTRAIHFGATLWLFGEFVFLVVVAGPAWQRIASGVSSDDREAERRLLRVAGSCVAIGIASALAWLLLEASTMSGTPLAAALDRRILETVVRETLFGRVWIYRFAISLLLLVTLWLIGRTQSPRHGSALKLGGTMLAGAYAALLAWTGHAAADPGFDRYIHAGCDAVHLLAAGAWLGALPGLLALLGRSGDAARQQGLALASSAARRFSTLGMVMVSALLVTGLVNSWYLVGSFSALLGSEYGHLLLWKLLLVLLMLTLAAINRLRLTPRLAMTIDTTGRNALTWLRRSIMLELAAGIAIVGIVAALGLTTPGVHMHDHEHSPSMTSEVHAH